MKIFYLTNWSPFFSPLRCIILILFYIVFLSWPLLRNGTTSNLSAIGGPMNGSAAHSWDSSKAIRPQIKNILTLNSWTRHISAFIATNYLARMFGPLPRDFKRSLKTWKWSQMPSSCTVTTVLNALFRYMAALRLDSWWAKKRCASWNCPLFLLQSRFWLLNRKGLFRWSWFTQTERKIGHTSLA